MYVCMYVYIYTDACTYLDVLNTDVLQGGCSRACCTQGCMHVNRMDGRLDGWRDGWTDSALSSILIDCTIK